MLRLLRYACVPMLLASAAAAQGPSNVFRAGAATGNITPPLGSPIVGGWDAPPAKSIHDELHTRALVLDDGQTRLAIVVSDNVGIPRNVFDRAKQTVFEKTGLPIANMLMSATHTHSAASARSDDYSEGALNPYQQFVASRIADAVQQAIHNLQPARIGWGIGREPGQVFNRRWKMKPGSPELANPFGGIDKVRMNPPAGHADLLEPAGPTDPEIHFISVQSANGRPIALLANYSLHYVGGVPANEISADYFGIFARRIGEMLGTDGQHPPFVGMLSNGTSGNINNINFRESAAARRKYKPYEKMTMVANLVAAEVFKVYQTIEHRDWVPLGAVQTEIPMGVRVPGPEDVKWAESVMKRPQGSSAAHIREAAYAKRALDMRKLPSQMPLLVQALRIGDLGITAIPAEVFVEIGLDIRKKSPFSQTFTISLANGAYGYLPTPEQHELGGYETWRGTNRLEVQASTKIVNTLTELLGQLHRR